VATAEVVVIEPQKEQYSLVYQLVKRKVIIILMLDRVKRPTAVQVVGREVSLGVNDFGAG
jgi:hypothetical protein